MRLKRVLTLSAVPVAILVAAGTGAGIAHASGMSTPAPSLSITAIGTTSVRLSLPAAERVQVFRPGISPQVYSATLPKGVRTVSGLSAGTAYDVRAANSRGWSDAILFVTTAAQGQAGPAGQQGRVGQQGSAGPAGQQGPAGPAGQQGPAGEDAQALPYGIGEVQVDRNGTGKPSTWAVYSTTLGSPVGDTASGEFEFTCSDVTDGCNISLQAYATAAGYGVYPRIVVTKQDNTTGDIQACEYGDGANNKGGVSALTTAASPVTVGYGSTWDCGGNQTGSPDSAQHLNVPGAAGEGEHYYVQTTWSFLKA